MLLLGSIILSIFIIVFLLIFSTVQIAIENFSKSNYDPITKEMGKKDFRLKFNLLLFHKLKVISISWNSEKVKKFYQKEKEQIDVKQVKKYVPNGKDAVEIVKGLHLEIAQFKLNFLLGTEDVLLTSGIISILSATLGIILPHVIPRWDEKQYAYRIIPLYQNKNEYKIDLDCIINAKMVHIICILSTILKRKRVDQNGRTSNRRAYDYSYE